MWSFRNEAVHSGKRKLETFEQLLTERIADFTSYLECGLEIGGKYVIHEKWSAPPANWLKGLVVIDEEGRVVFLASQVEKTSNAKDAELKALLWASELAKEKRWNGIVSFGSLLKKDSWKLIWNAKSANVVADAAAKHLVIMRVCFFPVLIIYFW
ncbi:hypothetical protein FNV43_RR15245 [Rhamnella rubrinervis]|uniref:RNase H type-1 domain-containing protein n=1 Tax=Rhamnella rubrinervis TaxID=2594499 RepID=A0A8K0E6Z0_9ROSA|nr:hypothetical protein FNV43_RR15245 [Rhamnella rubrinervis]